MENKNTNKAENVAVKIFIKYLEAMKLKSTEFHLFTEKLLDNCLSKFYWGARTEDKQLFKASTMLNYRY